MEIELLWPENPVNTRARHMKPLDSCFDLIRPHQQVYTVISPYGNQTSNHRMQSRNSTTDHRSTLQTNDAKLISYEGGQW